MAEVDQLRRLGRRMEAQEIAAVLGRTERSVDSVLRRFKIRLTELRAWTEDEDAVLRARAKDMTIAEIGAVLERTEDVIRHRAKTIGVKFTKRGEGHSASKYDDEIRQHYIDLVAAGTPKNTAAKRLGVPPQTAMRWNNMKWKRSD